MQPMIADQLRSPWALLPDRLWSICALRNGAFTRRQESSPVATSSARRRAANGTIAVLPFVGVAVQRTDALGEAIGLLSLWHFTQAFRAALADDTIGGIVIDVGSPGGSIYGVMELADEIYRMRARKPIAADRQFSRGLRSVLDRQRGEGVLRHARRRSRCDRRGGRARGHVEGAWESRRRNGTRPRGTRFNRSAPVRGPQYRPVSTSTTACSSRPWRNIAA